MNSAINGKIPHPINPPIYTEAMWFGLFIIMAGYLIWSHRKRTALSNTALMFLGAWSIFWQEFYNNWGGYLLYSPDLTLLPWGSTWWTSPNKPVFLIFSYPVFFTVIYSAMIWLVQRVQRAAPRTPLLVLTLLIVGPIFWTYNFLIDGASVDAGMWNYVEVIGPSVVTRSGGLEPLAWPMIPFAIYGALMTYSLLKRDSMGAPLFIGLGKPEKYQPGLQRETVRALTSIIWWNALYLCFTVTINLVRTFFGPPSALVP